MNSQNKNAVNERQMNRKSEDLNQERKEKEKRRVDSLFEEKTAKRAPKSKKAIESVK